MPDVDARRREDLILREPGEAFVRIFENAPIGEAIVSTDGRWLRVNRALCELVGYSADQLLTMTFQEITHPDDLDADLEYVRQMLDGRIRTYQMEKRYFHKKGHIVWILLSVSLVRDPKGEPLYFISQIEDITERKLAQQTLERSEARLAEAQSLTHVGSWEWNLEDDSVSWSDELFRLHGLEPTIGRLTSQNLRDTVHPDDRAPLEAAMRRGVETGEPFALEYRIRLADGSIRWIHGRGRLAVEDDGPLSMRGTAQDVTERKRAEEVLRKSEERFAALLESAPDAVVIADLIGRIVLVNEQTERLFGYARDELLEQPVESLLPEGIRDRQSGMGLELAGRRKDGTEFPAEVSLSTIDTSEGSLVTAFVRDNSERTEAEEKLRKAERRYRTLVEQLPLGMYVRTLNLGDANVYASPQVEQLLGYPAGEWETDPSLLERTVHPDDRGRALEAAKRVRRTGEPFRDEYRFVHRDGKVVWMRDETYFVEGEAGEPSTVQGFLLDVTERKQAEEERDLLQEELHHAQKIEAIGELAGGVAHEFNNMLMAIAAHSSLMLERLEPSSPLRRDVEQIVAAAERSEELIRQLLAFGRKQLLQLSSVDLNGVVDSSLDLLRPLIDPRVELVASLDPDAPETAADRAQIQQVLVNLMLNARDAIADEGTITITTTVVDVDESTAARESVEPGGYLRLAVSDTGSGMDEETLARIFEPFFTTKGPGKGSGLGLSTAYGIVRQGGGFLTVETEPGRGTTFTVLVPCRTPVPAPPQPPAEPATPKLDRRERAIVADDEEAVREVCATLLRRMGYSVQTAGDGNEALRLLEQEDRSVELLLTDVVMPGMSGPELARRLASRHPETRVVYMSGYPGDQLAEHDSLGDETLFLQKPFTPTELERRLQTALA
jgi:two-component system, cell cycle sensor histidine kinase and response regulator CckA